MTSVFGNAAVEENENEEAAFIHEFVVQVDACQDRQGDESAVRDLHECCHECAEAETFDNDGTEVGYTTVRDIAC